MIMSIRGIIGRWRGGVADIRREEYYRPKFLHCTEKTLRVGWDVRCPDARARSPHRHLPDIHTGQNAGGNLRISRQVLDVALADGTRRSGEQAGKATAPEEDLGLG